MSHWNPVKNNSEEIHRFSLCSREETELILKNNKNLTGDQMKKGLKISSYIDNPDYPLINVFLLSGIFLNSYEEFPAEQPEKIIGIKLSKRYKLIKGWDEQMLGSYTDMLHQFLDLEILKRNEVKEVYNKIVNSLLLLNPVLKSIEKIVIMSTMDVLAGVISRFDPNDISSFIIGIKGSESYHFYGDSIEFIKSKYKKAKFHYILSPHSVNKIIRHIKKNKTSLQISDKELSKLGSVNLLKIVKELYPI